MVAAAAVLNHEASTEGEVVVQNSIGANVRALLTTNKAAVLSTETQQIQNDQVDQIP